MQAPVVITCPETINPWWHWHPPVGTWIAFLALAGVLVPLFREWGKIGRREKAIWTALMFALVFLEIRTLYRDRDEHDREQALASCRLVQNFSGIASGINKSIEASQGQFVATMAQVNRTLDTTENVLRESSQTLINTAPHANIVFLGVKLRRVGEPLIFRPSVPLPLNVFYRNSGNDIARNVSFNFKVYVGKLDDAEDQKRLWQRFNEDWTMAKRQNSIIPTSDQPGFRSVDPSFTSEQLQGVGVNDITLYLFFRIAYTDNMGRWFYDHCGDLQDPLTGNGITHPCIRPDGRYKATQQ